MPVLPFRVEPVNCTQFPCVFTNVNVADLKKIFKFYNFAILRIFLAGGNLYIARIGAAAKPFQMPKAVGMERKRNCGKPAGRKGPVRL